MGFVQEDGTLKPYPRFNVEEDVQKLRKAMKGFGKLDLLNLDLAEVLL